MRDDTNARPAADVLGARTYDRSAASRRLRREDSIEHRGIAARA
jgi:hypothetical protein